MTFHGLSSPDDLKQMWRELKHDSDLKDINVIWDYTSPEQIQPGPNILNILYSPETPKETGHYVLAYLLPIDKGNKLIYFNPVASHTLDEISVPKLKQLNEYFKNNVYVDMSGTQPMNGKDSDSCGYYCLTKAFNIYNSLPVMSGKLPAEPTTKDYLADILKMLRAIYFRKVFSSPSSDFKEYMGKHEPRKFKKSKKEPKEPKELLGIPKPKTEPKGEGLSDDMPKSQSENITFSELKNEVEGEKIEILKVNEMGTPGAKLKMPEIIPIPIKESKYNSDGIIDDD